MLPGAPPPSFPFLIYKLNVIADVHVLDETQQSRADGICGLGSPSKELLWQSPR